MSNTTLCLWRDGILLSYQGRKVLVRLTGDKEFVYPRHADYADIGEDQFRWLFAEDRASSTWRRKPCRNGTALPMCPSISCALPGRVTWPLPASPACPCTTGTATTSIVAIAAAHGTQRERTHGTLRPLPHHDLSAHLSGRHRRRPPWRQTAGLEVCPDGNTRISPCWPVLPKSVRPSKKRSTGKSWKKWASVSRICSSIRASLVLHGYAALWLLLRPRRRR